MVLFIFMDSTYSPENPEKSAALAAISDVLAHGYVLNGPDVGDIISHYGYSPEYAKVLMHHHKTSKALAERGVALTTVIQGRQRVYFDEDQEASTL